MLSVLLDAHVSAQRVARPLRRDGHDVRAVSEEPDLEGSADAEVMELAVAEGRILVTFDVRDFSKLLKKRAAKGEHHAGCVFVVKIRNNEHGKVLRGLRRLFDERPANSDWRDITLILSPRLL